MLFKYQVYIFNMWTVIDQWHTQRSFPLVKWLPRQHARHCFILAMRQLLGVAYFPLVQHVAKDCVVY